MALQTASSWPRCVDAEEAVGRDGWLIWIAIQVGSKDKFKATQDSLEMRLKAEAMVRVCQSEIFHD